MFGAQRFGASAYQNTRLETGVIEADPHKLILMLFEGARMSIGKALFAIDQKDPTARGMATGNAIAIISQGLNNSLSWKADAVMADRLASLYEYMIFRLSDSNLKGERAGFLEVDRLLGELESAWIGIKPQKDQSQTRPYQERTVVAA